METDFDCAPSLNNGNDTLPAWIQSALSDLEENTQSMLSLIKHEDYKRKPELENHIEQFQKLYHLLLDQYIPILARFSISSISMAHPLDNTSPSNSVTEPCLRDVHPDIQLQDANDITNIVHKTVEEKSSTSDRHYESFSFQSNPKPLRNESVNSDIKLSVDGTDPEILEKCITEMSETSSKICGQSVLERWIDFEKRISTSEVILELVEDNKTHMDELLRRYKEQKGVNKSLREQIEVLMREIELLHDENLKLMSENKSLAKIIEDRIKEKRGSKFCSSSYSASVIKNSLSWLNACCKSPRMKF